MMRKTAEKCLLIVDYCIPYVFLEEKPANEGKYYKLLGLVKGKRVTRWIEKEYMTPRYSENNIDSYKVLLPESNGAGTLGEPLSTPIISGPCESSTPTFISIGNYQTKQEAENTLKYLKTKFVRALLGVLKKTQHNPAAVWAYVPIQDFTNNSSINWSLSISELDAQLYALYGLSVDEIEFIESKVVSMEG